MDVTSLRDELNKVIRDVNVALESYELQHQENIRVIEKFVQDGERSLKKTNAKRKADLMKRPLATVLAEELENGPRSSRSAAKVAATKIRNAIESENGESSKKRRCVVKLERLSVPQSVLDVIVEEQEVTDSSPDVKETPMKQEVPSVTVHNKPLSDFNSGSNKDKNGVTQTPSDDNQSPFAAGVVANSTFVLDVVQPESLKSALTDISKKNKAGEQSPTVSIQNKSCCGSELHSTFVISAGNAGSFPVKPSAALYETAEGQVENSKGNKNGPSQAKLPVENGLKENVETDVYLQKFITESPVRVTRTKTRAFAQAVAAANATTNRKENVQVSGLSNILMSPPFQKQSNKTTPEDSMKENYIISAEKTMKATAMKGLNSANRLKIPLSANNTLSSIMLQKPKTNLMGVGTVVSHCETFITKNATKPMLTVMNQKSVEESKYQEEKVIEAEKKKERMLKEKAEQQRRMNEARAAKVARTREQLERQRAIQQQQQEREKEQRLRIAQQKREEEIALKRQVTHQRAAEAEERRKQEEEQYFQAMKKKEQEEAERKALQLKKEAEEQLKTKEAEKNKKETKAKPIPSGKKVVEQPLDGVFNTNDIYSGEESEDEEITLKKVFPLWTEASRVRVQLSYQEICASLLDQLFQLRQHTPDLIKIFGTVPDKALVRTSSAVWNTPPCNKI